MRTPAFTNIPTIARGNRHAIHAGFDQGTRQLEPSENALDLEPRTQALQELHIQLSDVLDDTIKVERRGRLQERISSHGSHV